MLLPISSILPERREEKRQKEVQQYEKETVDLQSDTGDAGTVWTQEHVCGLRYQHNSSYDSWCWSWLAVGAEYEESTKCTSSQKRRIQAEVMTSLWKKIP